MTDRTSGVGTGRWGGEVSPVGDVEGSGANSPSDGSGRREDSL